MKSSSSSSKSKKRKNKTTLQSLNKKWKHKLDFDDDFADEDDDFGFNDNEAHEEISYSHKGDDDEEDEAEEASVEIPSASTFLQKFQPPKPEYAQLTIFEEKSNCDQCWGCIHRFGASRIRSKNSTMDKIFSEFMKNKADLPLEMLCILLQDMQAELVWRPSVKAVAISKTGVAVEPWPSDIVMSHLVDHIQDPALKMKALIRDAAIIEKSLKNTLIEYDNYPDGSKRATPVFKNILIYMKFNMYQMQISKNAEAYKSSADMTRRN